MKLFLIVISDGEVYEPRWYRGENVVYLFLEFILYDKKIIQAHLANKKPIVMTSEDWQKRRNATNCHICNRSLVKEHYLDFISAHDQDTGSRLLWPKWQKLLFCCIMKKNELLSVQGKIRQNRSMDWQQSGTCLFCAERLLRQNHKDRYYKNYTAILQASIATQLVKLVTWSFN